MYFLDASSIPRCSRFGRVKQKNGWERLDSRSIPANLFVLIIDGGATFIINEEQRQVRAGEVLIIPANTVYRAVTDQFCEYYFCHFNGALHPAMQPVSQPAPQGSSFVLPNTAGLQVLLPDQMDTGAHFEKICKGMITCSTYHAGGTLIGVKLLECEFFKILLTLASILERSERPSLPSALERITVYIKQNLMVPLSAESICAACGVSASYACRLFKKHLHVTLTEYVNNEKMRFAYELLVDTAMSLSQIAEYMGYCDVYYFSKRFKRAFGKAPSTVRKARR